METASRRSTRKNGYKRPMPPDFLVKHRNTSGGTWHRRTYVPTGRKTSEHLEQNSCDGSESNCCTYWSPKHADSDRLPASVDDGWSASRELPALLVSRPRPVLVAALSDYEFAEEPLGLKKNRSSTCPLSQRSLSHQAQAPVEIQAADAIHPVQFGIFSNRMTFAMTPCLYEIDILLG